MAYDEYLAQRIRDIAEPGVDEKKMFGGVASLLDGNIAVGVSGDEVMVRVGKDGFDDAVVTDGVRPFEMSGKRMAGWVLVGGEAIAEDDGLDQ
jgi:TfoX/Sxy family transcriptional regulator of competence genes